MNGQATTRWLTLFASFATLICCALPLLLVTLGFGATVAALTSSIPWLIPLSEHKAWIFLGSGVLLVGLAWLFYRPGQSCPSDPELRRLCLRARSWRATEMKNMRAVLWLLLALPLWALAAQKTIVEVEVQGMACSACSYRVEKALGKLHGVDSVRVSLKEKKARIVLAPGGKPDVDKIKQTITESGFTPGEAIVRTEEGR